jgi:hypothetical protein
MEFDRDRMETEWMHVDPVVISVMPAGVYGSWCHDANSVVDGDPVAPD